jgi:hypothetical protein
MQKLILLSVILLIAGEVATQPFQNVRIGNLRDPNETSIAISRKDTTQMVAGSNIRNMYRSTDGGLTWVESTLQSTHGVYGDPCVVTDTAGDFYFFHLSKNDSIAIWPRWCDRIVCQKSNNTGVSWTNGTFVGVNQPRMQDKEWVAVDPRTNYIAVTWTEFDDYGSMNPSDSSRILFSISKDGAQTWAAPKLLSSMLGDCVDEDNTVEGAVPAFGLNGEIYVVWAFRDSLYFIKSNDTGNTWMNHEVAIASQPAGWDYAVNGISRCNGLPVTLVDHSTSVNAGTIYVNWTDKRNGANDADVFLMKSTDGGDTWSVPVRVNDDAPGKENFFSWIDIDQTNGNLHIVFYDRRNYNDIGTDVYLASSDDGGASFINRKVSATPFYPNPSTFFGDYNGISAHNGCIRPMWTRLDNTTLSVWTAIVSEEDVVTGTNKVIDEEEFLMANPNPTNSQVVLHHNAASAFSISVVDMSGRKIFEDNTLDETYFFKFDEHNFSKGVYIVNCSSNLSRNVFKIIYE